MSISKQHRERGRRGIAAARRALAGHPDPDDTTPDEPELDVAERLPYRDDD